MDTLIKILVVEDEMIIGAKISMLLTKLGYEVAAILPRGEDAIVHAEERARRVSQPTRRSIAFNCRFGIVISNSTFLPLHQ